MSYLSDLHDELVALGIPIRTVRLRQNDAHEIVYGEGVTDEQKTTAEAAIAEWKKQPTDERLLSRAEVARKQLAAELTTLKAAVEADDKEALKQAVLKLLEIA